MGVPKQNPSLVLPGGQLMLTTDVENYPGFPGGCVGPGDDGVVQEAGARFGTRLVDADITRCEFGERLFVLHTSDNKTVRAHSVIIATGATVHEPDRPG
ncbi:MAG: hypothetical protein R3B46_11200 [Phycisphaerales bacterium]